MSETAQVFRIARSTGTHADVFTAVGLADLLATVPDGGAIRLIERESNLEVHFSGPLSSAAVQRIPQVPGYPFLRANERVRVPLGAADPVDYKAEKEKADRRKKVISPKGKKKAALDSETQQLMQQEQPREDWRLLQVLNTLQGDETSNKIHETIVCRRPEEFRLCQR